MRFTFDDLVAVMAHLRGPDGCPWDRDQTHASLAPYLLEETHEALDAITGGDLHHLRQELGDLLLQVVFHAQMAREAGAFDVGDVTHGLVQKLLDRHPHVFGDLRLGTPREVKAHWEELKRREAPDRSPLDGIPSSLPALARAQKIVERTSGVGPSADRPDPAETAAAAQRALAEVAATDGAGGARAPEAALHLGALLFAIAALAEAVGVDAEAALRDACDARVSDRAGR